MEVTFKQYKFHVFWIVYLVQFSVFGMVVDRLKPSILWFSRLQVAYWNWETLHVYVKLVHNIISMSFLRYAAILFKKQRYVSGQHKVNLKIICKENYKYEVQEKSPANQAVTVQQLAEEYWR